MLLFVAVPATDSYHAVTATSETTRPRRLCVDTIRTLSMDAVQKANSGHPGAPMGLAPLAYVLYTRVMRHNPSNPDWLDRDRFILSAGHASMLLYSMLYLTGYPMTLDDIEHFRQVGWPTAGHPERKYSPGIEATTGPLGQGISMSVGIALAEHMLAARFNRDDHEIMDHYTFVIASDGDMQEGVASEASSLAGHLGLGRLIVFYDDNKIQLAGPTSQSFSEDVAGRYEAYGWHVEHIGDVQDVGTDLSLDQIEEATRTAMAIEDRPSLILVRSHIGYGSPHKQDTSAAHGSPLGEEEVRLTKEAYGWDPDKQFYVPDEALAHFRRCCERGRELEAEWDARFDAYRREFPEQAALLEMIDAAKLPDGWDAGVPRFSPDDDPIATRKASGVDDPVGRKGDPAARRWVGRPLDLDGHGHRRRRRRREGPVRGSQPPLRRPRARDGRDRQRPRTARLPRLRRHLPDVLRLHARRRPLVGADEAAVDLDLHARLDRPR